MRQIPILSLTSVAVAAIAAQRFVDFAGDHTGAGEKPLGVADTAANTGASFKTNVLGTAKVEAGGVVAVGGPVKSDADGKAIAQGGTGTIAGYAIDAAAADGDIIEILLTP